MSRNLHTDWPLYVLQDLIGYLQKEHYLRTAELLSDAAFVFVEEVTQNDTEESRADSGRFTNLSGRKLN